MIKRVTKLDLLKKQLRDYEEKGCTESPYYAALKEKVELLDKEVLK